MKLRPALRSYIVEDLKKIVRLCGGPGPDSTRKEQLVEYIAGRLTHPATLAELWQRLDPLSQKAVTAAYHAGGEFDREAFVAQYGELPGERTGLSLPSILYVFNREFAPVDLFVHDGEVPEELMELLAPPGAIAGEVPARRGRRDTPRIRHKRRAVRAPPQGARLPAGPLTPNGAESREEAEPRPGDRVSSHFHTPRKPPPSGKHLNSRPRPPHNVSC